MTTIPVYAADESVSHKQGAVIYIQEDAGASLEEESQLGASVETEKDEDFSVTEEENPASSSEEGKIEVEQGLKGEELRAETQEETLEGEVSVEEVEKRLSEDVSEINEGRLTTLKQSPQSQTDEVPTESEDGLAASPNKDVVAGIKSDAKGGLAVSEETLHEQEDKIQALEQEDKIQALEQEDKEKERPLSEGQSGEVLLPSEAPKGLAQESPLNEKPKAMSPLGVRPQAMGPSDLFAWLKGELATMEREEEKTIRLKGGEYHFTETLEIKDGKKVTFVTEGDVKANFKRGETKGGLFKGTLIKIAKEAKLVLDARDDEKLSLDGGGVKGSYSKAGGLITTEGSLELKHATLKNQVVSGSDTGALVAKGPDAKITMTGGKITENKLYDLGWGAVSNAGAGVALIDGGKMTMTGGEISYNTTGRNYSNLAPGVFVGSKSSFDLEGGRIINNTGTSGAVIVGDFHPALYGSRSGDKPEDRAYMTMTGGEIANNKGLFDTGGLQVVGNASVRMTGGTIKDNEGWYGGGVYVNSMYVEEPTQGHKTYKGGSLEEWNQRFPAEFIMEGGNIIGNKAWAFNYGQGGVGGGICVSSDRVTLLGGKIADNYAADQGGGVYVTATPYTLKLKNVAVTDNRASSNWLFEKGSKMALRYLENGQVKTYYLHTGSGGGVWFCPTGKAEFYTDEGGAIFGNKAESMGDDFHSEDQRSNNYTVSLPSRILGGAKSIYYVDEAGHRYKPGTSEFYEKISYHHGPLSLKTIVEDESGKTTALSLAKLFITGNKASKGGGIGSNGNVVIGNKPGQDVAMKELEVEKVWENVPEAEIKEVKFEVGTRVGGVEHPFEVIVLNKGNDFKATLKELPDTIGGYKLESVLYIKELTTGDYIFEPSKVLLKGEKTGVNQLPNGDKETYSILKFSIQGVNTKPEKPPEEPPEEPPETPEYPPEEPPVPPENPPVNPPVPPENPPKFPEFPPQRAFEKPVPRTGQACQDAPELMVVGGLLLVMVAGKKRQADC